jgi:ribonuclease HIII
VRRFLQDRRYHFEDRPNALFLARGPAATVTMYRTGKILVTGEDAEVVGRLIAAHLGIEVGLGDEEREEMTTPRYRGRLAAGPAGVFEGTIIGSDESGKGDYFGSLVVAGVAVPTADAWTALARMGVRDSKEVAERAIGRLADGIEAGCPFAIVEYPPEDYNRAFLRVGNQTKLLLDAHERVIRDLAKEAPPAVVVVDQFPGAQVLRKSFGADLPARIDIRPRAEDNLAVAAASIVARRRFLASLTVLSAEAGIELPRGAGAPVRAAVAELGRRRGTRDLAHFAKTHFVLR